MNISENQKQSYIFVFLLIGLFLGLMKTIPLDDILSNIVRVYDMCTGKIAKKNLVKYYGVNKKTFSNWVRIFCKEGIDDFEGYKKKRKLEVYEAVYIVSTLGFPEVNPTLNKKDIIEKEDSNYYHLRESCRAFDLTREDFIQIRKFPPNISKSISEKFTLDF